MTSSPSQPAPAAVERNPSGSRRRSLLLALLGGLLTTASVPPFGWWPLGIAGLGLLAVAVRGRRALGRMAVGMVFGLGLYGVSLWWMTAFSLPGGIFVAVLQASFLAVAMLLVARHQPWITTPAAVVVADALRSLWPFGGLPLGGIDLGQAAGPLARSAAFGGRLLVIALAATIGAAFAAAFFDRRREAVLLGSVLTFLVIAVNVLPDGTRNGGSVRVAIVQGGGPRGTRASEQGSIRAYKAHVDANALLKESVDLILWPENVIDVDRFDDSPAYRDVAAIAKQRSATMVVGVTSDGPPKRFLNQSIVVTPDGRIGERYDKVRRVPYGEYFPFRKQIEAWGLATLPARDALPGTRHGVIRTPVGTFAILISYEGFFDDRARVGVRDGGSAILLPTNASSYSTSQVPTQQIAAAQLRAIETGRFVVQAAPTGLSAVVDHQGEVLQRSTLGKREVLVATIRRRAGLTPYARTNDVPLLLTSGLMLLIGHAGSLWAARRQTS